MVFGRWRTPGWSAFDDRKTHEQFVETVHAMLREEELSFAERDDGRTLALEAGASLDLETMTVAASRLGPDGWHGIVRDRLRSATNPRRAPSDAASLRPAVRTRLMTADAFERFPKQLPHQDVADLVEVLVITTAQTLVWAGEQDLAPLDMSLPALFALARQNVRDGGPPQQQPLTTADGDGLAGTVVLTSRRDDVACWLPMLGDALELAPSGALVAVPTRESLLVAPDADAAGDDTVAALTDAAADGHEAGPGALSPGLYRWVDGRITRHH